MSTRAKKKKAFSLKVFFWKTYLFSNDFLVSQAYPMHCSVPLSWLIDSVSVLPPPLSYSSTLETFAWAQHKNSFLIKTGSISINLFANSFGSWKIGKCGAFWAAQCWHIYWIEMLWGHWGILNKHSAKRIMNSKRVNSTNNALLCVFPFNIYLNLHSTRAIFLCFSVYFKNSIIFNYCFIFFLYISQTTRFH